MGRSRRHERIDPHEFLRREGVDAISVANKSYRIPLRVLSIDSDASPLLVDRQETKEEEDACSTDSEDWCKEKKEFASRLQTAKKEENRVVSWTLDVLGFGRQSVSLYWSEKLLILSDYLQYFALLRALADEWPWPYWFASWSKWTLLFNFDLALYSNASFEYRNYVIGWLFAIAALGFSFLAIRRFLRHSLLKQRKVERLFLNIAQVLYLPFAIAILRFPACNYGCTKDGFHGIAVFIVLALASLYLVAFPLWMARKISKSVTYRRNKDHRRFIEGREAEFLLGLNGLWELRRIYLLSSFCRPWVYHKVLNMGVKLMSACLLGFLSSDIGTMTLCILILWCAWEVPQILRRPYRSVTSTVSLHILSVGNLLNVLMGYLLTMHIRSAFFVDSIFTMWLIAMNCAVLGGFSILNLVAFFRKAGWPVTPRKVAGEVKDYMDVLEALEISQNLVAELSMRTEGFASIIELEEMIDIMNECWDQAKRNHYIIQSAVSETLEEMIYLYNILNPSALKLTPQLKAVLPVFRRRLDQRYIDWITVDARKRRIVLKLQAVRAFLGDRCVARLR